MTVTKRKLIEVALPLEAISRACQHEKSVPRKGHPATMHLWWARRPLAACRAVLFAQLVDDPSSHPDRFPTEEAQAQERRRLFDLIEELVKWENSNDERLLKAAYEEIARCFDGKPPAILDPFAGGGSIPLEAQRLGLEARASDLNPIAVLINKALIEIPPRFARQAPVFPGAAESQMGGWPRATGLAEDVRRYGQWIRDEAEKRIGHLYPKVKMPDGSKANVVAWIWARKVLCPNPACGADIPLVSSWWLCKKRGRETWIKPVIENGQVRFDIATGPSGPPQPTKVGRGATFSCLVCSSTTTDAYVKNEALAGRMGTWLLSIVAEGDRQRRYLPASDEQLEASRVPRPAVMTECPMPTNGRWFSPPAFGLVNFSDLFTNRQLVALATFSDLIKEARDIVQADAVRAGMLKVDANDYANAVATYLSFALSKLADWSSTICGWIPQIEGLRNTFSRQAIPMVWDFGEINIFSRSTGNWRNHVEWVAAMVSAHQGQAKGCAFQADAVRTELPAGNDWVTATDPPYYDNIGYADLSDFFYIWIRRSLGHIYPELLGTVLTPKSEELVATPFRFGGSRPRAEEHFEQGLLQAFARVRQRQDRRVPITVFYAFKQAETDDQGMASTGWEKMLASLINAGLVVTATWPMRTERSGRSIGIGTNSLASSVVLACRPRGDDAIPTTRRIFLSKLKEELPAAMRALQQGSIPPVDLAQAAIGPGMAIFSRYSKVVEPDGTDMTVRTALTLINQVLDEVLAEQEGDFDTDTRFCVRWFQQFGWDEQPYGRADELSRATNTSVDGLIRGGVFWSRAGKARLLEPSELSDDWDAAADDRISIWEVVLRLTKALNEKGVDEAARLMAAAGSRVDLDAAKELAYRLYSICEKKGWSRTGLLFNSLGTSWRDLSAAARTAGALTPPPAQAQFDFGTREE